MKMKTKAQHTSISGIKRKVELESEVKLNKVNANRKNKMPLKNDLIIEIKDLQEKYRKLEENTNRDIEILKVRNKDIEDLNEKLLEEVNFLKQNVP